MSKVFLRRTLSGFAPDDENGKEVIKGIKVGEVIKCEITRPRNVKFHRLFFGLLNLVYENTEQFKSVEHLLTVCKIGIGHADLVKLQNGQEYWHPRSISFAVMDEDQFRTFWDRSVNWLIANVLPVGKSELESELFSLLGYDLNNLR